MRWLQRSLKQTVKSRMWVVLMERTHLGSHGSAISEEMSSFVRLMMITSKMTSTFVDWAAKCLTMIMLLIWFWMLNPLMVSFPSYFVGFIVQAWNVSILIAHLLWYLTLILIWCEKYNSWSWIHIMCVCSSVCLFSYFLFYCTTASMV